MANDKHEEPPEAKKLKNKIKGHLSHLSKELDSWKGLIDLAIATKHERNITRMNETAKKCESILDKCRDLTLEANELEPDNENTLDCLIEAPVLLFSSSLIRTYIFLKKSLCFLFEPIILLNLHHVLYSHL